MLTFVSLQMRHFYAVHLIDIITTNVHYYARGFAEAASKIKGLLRSGRSKPYQLLLAGQVGTFRVKVPQGSWAQLFLGVGDQDLCPGDAGEQQQQCAEERSGALLGAGVRHPLELRTSQIAAPPRANTFYLTSAICSLHLSLWLSLFLYIFCHA